MKGISFQNGFEIKVKIEGESWHQGAPIRVKLESSAPTPLFLALSEGSERKIKAKSDGAIQPIETVCEVGLGIEHTFHLSPHARMTDRAGSLYLSYGAGAPPAQPAHLKLNLKPHPHLLDACEVLTGQFRFALKSTLMGKKDFVEFKLVPSPGKEWTALEELLVRGKIDATHLHFEFVFLRKEISALKSTLTAETKKREFTLHFSIQETVHEFNQRLNTEFFAEALTSLFLAYREQGNLLF